MVLSSDILLKELIQLTKENIKVAEKFKTLSTETLNWKPDLNSWSILECIEHLNRYSDFYIPEITKRIKSSKQGASPTFKSNWLGNYFSKSVSYSDKLNKMKTFKSMNPVNSKLKNNIIDKFIEDQNKIIALLNTSKNVNLDKTKTAISISKLIKLKLGDTFRVLIYHNERHIKQAEKVFTLSS